MKQESQLTDTERKILYQWIVRKFGSWKEWNERYTPSAPSCRTDGATRPRI